jgi:hypothetical protein
LTLRILTRKTKLGLLPIEEDICKILFTKKRAQHACRLFLNLLRAKGSLSRTDMSKFAWDLDRGNLEKGFSYSRTRFYTEVRRTLISTGLLSIEARFIDSSQIVELSPDRKRRRYEERRYVAVHQPISVHPPSGLNLPRLIWIVCSKWNKEFSR